MWGRVGEGRMGLAGLGYRLPHSGRRRGGGRGKGTCPDQTATVVHDHLGMRVEECFFQVFQGVIVERELALQGPIREALVVLEPVEHLCEDLFEGHSRPPAPWIAYGCASPGPILLKIDTVYLEGLC